MLTGRFIAMCPPALRAPLARYLAGEASGEITLMHFALSLGDAGLLGPLLQGLTGAAPEREDLADLLRLAVMNMDHLAQVTALGNGGLVNIPSGGGDGVAAIRRQFDRAVALAPEAAVALYSLGSAEILEHATNEIVSRLAEWGLLRADFERPRHWLRHRADRARSRAAGRCGHRHRRLVRNDRGGATAVQRSGECRLRAVQRA